MRYLDEYRDRSLAANLLAEIRRTVTRPWVIMEVCGGQTHSIVKYGIDELLPPEVELVHGPGCPVCVTPLEMIDRAHAIARRPEVIFCSFGDMLRVPGSAGDLFTVKAAGGDVRVVYSPMDCLRSRKPIPTASGLLRHRLRDHRPRERHGGLPGEDIWPAQFLAACVARPCAARHRDCPASGPQPRARLPRTGARLRRHGMDGI